jgi:hypothetical protein
MTVQMMDPNRPTWRRRTEFASTIRSPGKGPVFADSPNAFMPVVSTMRALPPATSVSTMTFSLHGRLANSVEFDLGKPTIDELSAVVQMLGRMPCFGSTKT